ncbi:MULTISPECIES: radical SAM family heme chaperone HemW [unclassified Leucobacter]|uniref:radical SAM family heme chaperone HemW n=1 Tax=unclassified Leucobacter TaxID=2621730 RepID=UPI00165E75C7|nr:MULTISPECIES: radical SAM family heme chaperone HemW [unclassified Leucobacter]MBC9926866.1 coproporphyrinogen III oxidase [Leucobacter sp. cx-169]MBC9935172.1 coproporphyrinogen III oxidase [Leucobacter sp. cx-87]
MPSVLPDGIPAPEDGSLPASVLAGARERAFGVYVHVPYCRVRCGYCDFNTYTASELRGTTQESYADEVQRELALGAEVLRRAGLPERAASTVFFGGGTPTLLPASDLGKMLGRIRAEWGIADGAEVTTEANPDSVDAAYLVELKEAGFTRVSFGMQSAVPSVLATLDRTHSPERLPLVTRWAREAGLQVSVDLIYGTPGETIEDWERSLDAAIALEPDHLSAYALIVEAGTKLAARIKRGEVAAPDDDLHAEMYELADARLGAAGFSWYEVSNWAKGPEFRSRHNLSYWTGEDWWGAGPGAHSHVGGVRWWNVKHPAAYAERMARGVSPAHARELLDDEARRTERVLLESRISDGLPVSALDAAGRQAVAGLIADELVDPAAAFAGRVVPTLRGRLLADIVVHRLLGA